MNTDNGHKIESHTILLGGLGGDSHSVGLSILRQALMANGYKVHCIGTQNSIEDFFQLAGLCNVVMISSMDGHAPYYLRSFPELQKQSKSQSALWYLGGNLHIGSGNGYEREFMDMGFNRVFVKFIDVASVLEILEQDLSNIKAVPDSPTLWEKWRSSSCSIVGAARDTLLDREVFERERRCVIEHWKTGVNAKDLTANAEFLYSQPSFAREQELVTSGRMPVLIQPRSGVPLITEQIRNFNAFKNAGARVLSYQVDSLTRNNNYSGAEEAIRESLSSGVATINGFPVVNHGVPGLRRIIREVGVPLQTRHSTRDPRLLAEISYAGGVTSYEGGAICYNIPYYKDYPLDESIKNWQYVDLLTGEYYARYGIVLDREFFGTLTATLTPPSLAIVSNIIESILAARQGVKSVSLGYAEQGNRIQDIAAIRAMGQIARDILGNLGYKNIQINTVFYQYMAAFPQSYERSIELIYHSAITAVLSGATRIIGKTPAESSNIPVLEDNIVGLDLIRQARMDAHRYVVDESRVAEEQAMIRKEVEAILDSIIFCGHGDIAQGVITGFEKGYIDIPFSPSIYNRGEVLTARDNEGSVRYLSIGQLQFNRELRQFHEHKMSDRRRAEGLLSRKLDYLLVERDVLQIARSRYNQWPLSA
jgi:methylaspartate mutase epsilon subunit